MQFTVNIKLLYVLSLVFILANILLLGQEIYWLLPIPLVILVLNVLVRKPAYILYLLALATPLSVKLSTANESMSLSMPTEPLIILLFFGLMLYVLQKGRINSRQFTSVLSILLIADLLWLVITATSSTMPLVSFKYVLSKSWYIVVFYFLLTHLFQKQKVVKIFIWCLIISSTVLAAYTLYNHAAGSFSRSYAYTAMRPFLPDHGMYAAAISFVVPPLFIFAVYGKELNYSWITRGFAIGLFAFLVLAVALSFTRASWVSLVVAFGVYVALLLRIKFRYILMLAVGAAFLLSSNFTDIMTELSRNKSESDDNIEEHLQSVSNVTSDPSNLERLNRWSCAVRMWQDKPIMGFGPGTYTFQYGVYQLPHEMTIISTNVGDLGNVHSEYLRPLVEGGVLSFLLFVALVITIFVMGFHQYEQLEGAWKYLSLAAFLGLTTYLTHGVLNNYSEFDKIAVPLYSFLAVMSNRQIALKRSKHAETDTEK